jgi:anti-sigma-K factor RskA
MTLGGESKFGQATARVVMDAAGQQVLLLASRVPPLPAGQTYQLWVIISGTPRSLGVFTPDPEGRVVHVESESLTLASDAKVAVSVEPSGGVAQPTGPIVLISH